MKTLPLKITLLLVALCTMFSAEAQSDILSYPDTLVVNIPKSTHASLDVLVPPEGFEVSEYFNGYIHLQAASSIIMTHLSSVNYIKLSEGMTEAFYEENKLDLVSIADLISDNGTKGLVYKFSFDIDKTPFIRYMVYAGGLNETLWLNVTYPAQYEPVLDEQILKCFQTINFKREE